MGRIFLYDVYAVSGEEPVLESMTAEKIQEHFGTDYERMTVYTREKRKNLYLGQYIIVPHGAQRQEDYIEPEQQEDNITYMPESWAREWTEVCGRIRKICRWEQERMAS